MDPYDFSENGYRCTVTVARLVPDASWWFPSCTKCSRSCAPDGAGYKCNSCASTSFKFKYKISFIALDIGRRIIGKPVQQVLRTATSSNAYPADILKIVSLRFTFAVTLTQQSYYRHHKTYQVASVITSYGQRDPTPPGPSAVGGGGPSAPQLQLSLSVETTEGSETASPTHVLETTVQSSPLQSTPPSSLNENDTPPQKTRKGTETGKAKPSSANSSVRKRLSMSDVDGAEDLKNSYAKDNGSQEDLDRSCLEIPLKDLVPGKSSVGEKKRARTEPALVQESV